MYRGYDRREEGSPVRDTIPSRHDRKEYNNAINALQGGFFTDGSYEKEDDQVRERRRQHFGETHDEGFTAAVADPTDDMYVQDEENDEAFQTQPTTTHREYDDLDYSDTETSSYCQQRRCGRMSGQPANSLPYPPDVTSTQQEQTRVLYNTRSNQYGDYAAIDTGARMRWQGPDTQIASLGRQRSVCRRPGTSREIPPGEGSWCDPYGRDVADLEHRLEDNKLLKAIVDRANQGGTAIGRETTWVHDPEDPAEFRDPIVWTADLDPLIADRQANYGQKPDPTNFYRSREALMEMLSEDRLDTRDPYMRRISSTSVLEQRPRTRGEPPAHIARDALSQYFTTLV